MTLNFQNKIVFPAPESSYTTETAYGQVIYLPRSILQWPKRKRLPKSSDTAKLQLSPDIQNEENTLEDRKPNTLEVK